jgi:thioredoxin-dependent peroxiredoxin
VQLNALQTKPLLWVAFLGLFLLIGGSLLWFQLRKVPSETVMLGVTLPTNSLFEATNTPDQTLNLSEAWQGHYGVLIFYPMDQTPGCTVQLCALRDHYADFATHNVKIAGVNPAGLKSHQAFSDKHRYPFPILVDKHHQLAKRFGVRKTLGVSTRTVVVLSPQNGVIWKKEGMPSPDEILNVVKADKASSEGAFVS